MPYDSTARACALPWMTDCERKDTHMLKDEYKVYEDKMKKSIDSVAADFAAVRAGRANASRTSKRPSRTRTLASIPRMTGGTCAWPSPS